jgi:hypothetical protein
MNPPTMLPCPFCGSVNLCRSHGTSIICFDCGAQGPSIGHRLGGSQRAEARIVAWNRRGVEPLLTALLGVRGEIIEGAQVDTRWEAVAAALAQATKP